MAAMLDSLLGMVISPVIGKSFPLQLCRWCLCHVSMRLGFPDLDNGSLLALQGAADRFPKIRITCFDRLTCLNRIQGFLEKLNSGLAVTIDGTILKHTDCKKDGINFTTVAVLEGTR